MDSIVVNCETCGQRFKAPASAVGRETTCSFCGGAIVIQALANAEESFAGYVDLSDDDDGDVPTAAPDDDYEETPRRGRKPAREREGFFDMAAGGSPREDLPRRGRGGGGTARRGRDTGRRDTGRRTPKTTRREAPDEMRASRAGGARRGGTGRMTRGEADMRRSGASRAPSSHRTPGAPSSPPWKLIGIGAGGLVMLIIIISVVISNKNAAEEAERVREEKRQVKLAKDRAKAERRARNKALYQEYKTAQKEAEDAADEDSKRFDEMNAERARTGGTEVPRSEFRSERAAELFVKAGRIAENVNHKDKALYCWKKALEYDRDHKDANTLLGHEKYQKPSERRTGKSDDDPEVVIMQELYNEGFLDDLDQYHGRWFPKAPGDSFELLDEKLISIEEIETIERKLVSEGRAELSAMKADPYVAAVRQVKRNLASQEILKDFNWRSRDARPYVVFEASPLSDAEDAPDPAADARMEHKLAILRQLYTYFKTEWAQPFGITRDETKPLVILSLRDRKAFDAYNVKMKMRLPAGVIAYYSPTNRWIVAYNGVQTMFAKSKEEQEILNDGTMFHEGTHQLVDVHVNKERYGTDRIARTRWLDEGLCEFIGSVALDHTPDKKRWKLEQRPDQRLQELISWLDAENSEMLKPMIQQLKMIWPMIKQALKQQGIEVEDSEIPKGFFLRIPDMVKCLIYPHVGPLVLKGVGGPLQGMLNDRVTSLMYAQSVMFWYFCKNYKNGKYWDALMRYMRWEWGLAGESPPDVRTFDPAVQEQYLAAFKMAFKDFEIDDIDREFWEYVDSMAKDVFGKSIPNPPLGK